jgi:hypothetical protein
LVSTQQASGVWLLSLVSTQQASGVWLGN